MNQAPVGPESRTPTKPAGANRLPYRTFFCPLSEAAAECETPLSGYQERRKKVQIFGLFCYLQPYSGCNVDVIASSFAALSTCVYPIVWAYELCLIISVDEEPPANDEYNERRNHSARRICHAHDYLR